MSIAQIIEEIPVDQLLSLIRKKWDEEARLVVIVCSRTETGFEISYTFDREYQLGTLRIHTDGSSPVPSISGIYLAAFPHENEIADLYGITFEGLVLDYHGSYIRTMEPHPFGKPTVTVRKGGDSA
jgi:ech hydrogenase subunit D